MALPSSSTTTAAAAKGYDPNKSYLVPFILVTSLFLLWGVANKLNSALIAHFQPIFDISRAEALLVETAFYLGYFTIALPAGIFMEKYGYKKGIIFGLLLYSVGAFLFVPSANFQIFGFFLIALYVIASGLAFLETAANPYVTILGKPETSVQRLNFAQAFNGLGLIFGPVLSARLIFSGNEKSALDIASLPLAEQEAYKAQAAGAVILPYVGIALIVLVVAFLIYRTQMPEPQSEGKLSFNKSIFKHSNLVWGVITQFFYVGAQVSIWGIIINFVTEMLPGTSMGEASEYYDFAGIALFLGGRYLGTFLMGFFKDSRMLALYAFCAAALTLVGINAGGQTAVYAILATNLFMSIMFPTIFALSVKGLGKDTKLGSSFIIMSIVGGALIPPIMGVIADKAGIQAGFYVPFACFLVVLFFALSGHKTKNHTV